MVLAARLPAPGTMPSTCGPAPVWRTSSRSPLSTSTSCTTPPRAAEAEPGGTTGAAPFGPWPAVPCRAVLRTGAPGADLPRSDAAHAGSSRAASPVAEGAACPAPPAPAVIAISYGPSPTTMGLPALLVAVAIGVTVSDWLSLT